MERMREKLPPGSRAPAPLQTAAWWFRPIAFMERNRARYGKRFTFKLAGSPYPFVSISEPDELKELFKTPPDVLHPGEGAQILEPVVGTNSVILLDEGPHLEQRKLMLPAFHGERIERLNDLIVEIAQAEIASWPRGEPIVTHPRLSGLTLEMILRGIFGLDPGPRLERLRELLAELLKFGEQPTSMIPQLQRSYFGGGPFVRFVEIRDQADELLFGLMDERRAEGAERDDVLTALLAAKHEDGSPMSDQEIRDELLTMLVAGHETSASELAWAFEALAREPRVQDELISEIGSDDGDAYLKATVHETLRRRPVLPNAEPRLAKKPVTIGGWDYPPDVCLFANAYLLHHDPDYLPRPVRLPPRALPRHPARHLHLDPLRRRTPPLHRRQLRDDRDADHSPRAAHRGPHRGCRPGAGADPPPRDHDQPEEGRANRLARPQDGSSAKAAGGRTGRGPRLVLEQRVAVLAALVGELGDRRHPLVVVRLDLLEAGADAAGGTGAEGVGDVALLAGWLDALILEDLR